VKGIIGKKLGMTTVFGEDGQSLPVTLIEAGPCKVVQVKTPDRDGYDALQLVFEPVKEKRVNKPLLGHFKRAGTGPFRVLREFRDWGKGELKVGAEVKVDIFSPGELVDVIGISKGKGFTGVVKRHGFRGGPKTHGQSDRYRAPGSIGASSNPSRVFKGTRMAGRVGGGRVTVRNLELVKVDSQRNLLAIKGSLPGPPQGYLIVRKTKR
jgi:large subunit ribosomal protein L3